MKVRSEGVHTKSRVEQGKGLVKVEYFGDQCNGDEYKQKVDEPMFKLVVTHDRRDNGCSKSSRARHGKATDQRAYPNIPQHTLLTILWCKENDDDKGRDDNDTTPDKEARRQEELLKL